MYPNSLTPVVQKLIITNIAIYLLLQLPILVPIGDQFFTLFKVDLIIPHNPSSAHLFSPIQIVTYFFNHGSIQHILFNMLALYFIGPHVERVLGSNRFTTFYLFCGIVSGILLAFLDPSPVGVVGASGAILGVMVAFALFFPREKFLFYFVIPIEARWLVIGTAAVSAFFVFQNYLGIQSGGNISHFGHLAGMLAAVAFFYLRRFLPIAR